MNEVNSGEAERVFRKLMFKSSPAELTGEDIAYFRENPDLIDEVTAPVNIHKYFLWLGTLLGVLLVALSKYLKFSPLFAQAFNSRVQWHASVPEESAPTGSRR